MVKHYFWIFLLLCSSPVLIAQHCPFDASGMITLNIHSERDTAIVPGLKVKILDYEYPARDMFWQNPPKTTLKKNITTTDTADLKKVRFPFADANYVLVCPFRLNHDAYLVQIEDVDGESNGGFFETRTIRITQADVFSLCGTYKMETIPDTLDGMKTNFKPIEVVMKTMAK